MKIFIEDYGCQYWTVSTSRAQLINKGIIYSVKYKELDFTVPEFDGFIKRLEEYQEWRLAEKL